MLSLNCPGMQLVYNMDFPMSSACPGLGGLTSVQRVTASSWGHAGSPSCPTALFGSIWKAAPHLGRGRGFAPSRQGTSSQSHHMSAISQVMEGESVGGRRQIGCL